MWKTHHLIPFADHFPRETIGFHIYVIFPRVNSQHFPTNMGHHGTSTPIISDPLWPSTRFPPRRSSKAPAAEIRIVRAQLMLQLHWNQKQLGLICQNVMTCHIIASHVLFCLHFCCLWASFLLLRAGILWADVTWYISKRVRVWQVVPMNCSVSELPIICCSAELPQTWAEYLFQSIQTQIAACKAVQHLIKPFHWVAVVYIHCFSRSSRTQSFIVPVLAANGWDSSLAGAFSAVDDWSSWGLRALNARDLATLASNIDLQKSQEGETSSTTM